jgi:hypothetical protein
VEQMNGGSDVVFTRLWPDSTRSLDTTGGNLRGSGVQRHYLFQGLRPYSKTYPGTSSSIGDGAGASYTEGLSSGDATDRLSSIDKAKGRSTSQSAEAVTVS